MAKHNSVVQSLKFTNLKKKFIVANYSKQHKVEQVIVRHHAQVYLH